MSNSRILALIAILLGILLLVVAGIYWAEQAKSLPSFFPGHDAKATTHHIKHGVAALVVGLGCFVFAWFQSGPKRSPRAA